MADLDQLLRTGRLELVELLEQLTPEEWATRSLCAEWTVQEVAAHLAWAPSDPPWSMGLELLRRGFRVNRMNTENARRWARRGPAATTAQLRAVAESGATPFGVPRLAPLTDAIVHSLDICRPLGRSRAVSAEEMAPVAAYVLGTRLPAAVLYGGSSAKRVAGLRLVADDVGWEHGSGPEVRGAATSLLLVLTGRPVEPEELSGPGASQLLARL